MVDQGELTHGGIYITKPNPAKAGEMGKVRPAIVLTAPKILLVNPGIIFICPLSSKSLPELSRLHIKLQARDGIHTHSFTITEQCRSISRARIITPRLAQLTDDEIAAVKFNIARLINFDIIRPVSF